MITSQIYLLTLQRSQLLGLLKNHWHFPFMITIPPANSTPETFVKL